MNRLLLLTSSLFLAFGSSHAAILNEPPVGDTSCTYTLYLSDSYGDGWNEASVRVTNLTTGGYHDYTISSYGYNDTHSFSVVEGHQYGLSWNSGLYDMECQFFLKDNLGETIYEYEPDYDPWGFPAPPTGTFFVFTAMCTDQMCSSPTSLREISHTPYTSTLRWAMDDTSVHRYKLLYGTSQDPDSMLSIITNDSTYTLTGLSPDSTYHVQLRAMCDTDAYSRWPLVTDVFTGYCTPSSYYGWDNLTRFAFGSGAEMLVDEDVAYGYVDRHNRVGGVVAGDTLYFSLTFQYNVLCTYIWVDWNSNCQFENNELIVYNSSYSDYAGTRDLFYVIPEACPSGNYRMRCITYYCSYYGSTTPNPCDYAEDARDYTLHVISADTIVHRIYFDSMVNGTVTINGNQYFANETSVVHGSSITITAVPDQYCLLQTLIVNGNTVTNPYTMTVTGDVHISASFIANLPELHVTSLTCSDIVAGQNFNVSWTVRNDGHASTPTGTTWLDRLYLSTTPYVNTSNEPLLLGSWQNISALDSGQTYTRSVSVALPLRQAPGQYYLFLLTDAVNAYNIQWGGSNPDAYNPPPYVLATCYAYNNSIVEISEMNTYRSNYNYWESQAYQHDNFNMKTVQVTVPSLADLEVTDINPQTNFYSGTQVMVSATITNTGSVPTLSSGWHDVLYISTSPTFSTATALQLSSIWHPISSNLAPDSSYQVTFTGVVPLSWYGEAYFYVTTDYENNEYEYLADSNNTSRSGMVNILLTPPADLVVSNVTVPIVASNQMPINVNFTVTNMGEGNPDVNDWYDKVYLSTSPTLPTVELNGNGIGSIYNYGSIPDSVDWYYTLEQIAHVGGLATGDHYSINRNYTLPTFITDSGLFYFIVVTDAGNNVFEYQSDNNNTTASQASSISFYFPDLVVDTIIVADSINNNESFSVTYSISNRGMGKAVAPWYDYVAISGNQLAYSLHDTDLMPGESYSVGYTCSMPNSFITTMDRPITVTVDCNNNVDEKTNEGNNSFSVTSYATIFKPDFYISEILLPDTIVTGHSLDLQFTVNNGGRHDYAGNIYYIAYYSYDSTLNYEYGYPSNATFLQSYQPYITLPINERQTIVQSITFPNSVIDSDYYVYILVNPDGYIPEDNIQNNTLRSGPHFVCHRPLPDLVLLNVSIPDTLHAGELATISFDITNVGETTEYSVADINSSTFYTALYVNDYWCPIRMQISPVEAGSISLAVGDTLHFVQTVQVSPITSGNLNFTLTVDAHNNIQELYENNNSYTVSRYVHPVSFDLAVQSLNTVDSCMTGDTVTFSYTANINGYSAFFQHANNDMVDATGFLGRQRWVDTSRMTNPLWHDNLLISHDRFATFDDRMLGRFDISLSDITDGSYTITRAIAMPHDFSGSNYLIVVADSARHNIENNNANNTYTKSITITQEPYPNLRIISLSMDDSVAQRQGCVVRYTVLNDGMGPTRVSHWIDKFYCGGLLIEKNHEGILLPGESYTDSIEIVIPINLIGNYTFTAITDADNNVYEHNQENDNNATHTIVIFLNPPCDLIVSKIEVANNVSLISPFTVRWCLKNIGTGGVYERQVVDAITFNGVQLYFDSGYVNIGPGDSLERTATIQLPCIADTIGTVSITTDYNQSLEETEESNNTANSTIFSIIRPQLSEFTRLDPPNNSILDTGVVVFSWTTISGADYYDLFVWENDDNMPSFPTLPNLAMCSVMYSIPDFTSHYGSTLHWKIVARNRCDSLVSPVRDLFLLGLPDLHVTGILNSDPVAGESMDIEYTVKNDGYGPTPQGVVWYDHIYAVSDVDVSTSDPVVMHGYLGSYPNIQSLSAGQSYTNHVTVAIPRDLYGNYFLFVISDQNEASSINFSETGGIAPIPYTPDVSGVPYHYLLGYSNYNDTVPEIEDNDNFFYKMITIQPPPSPDLTVTHVSHPIDAFSNTDIPVSWTVANQGRMTATGRWKDKVYIQTTASNSLMNAFLLAAIERTDSVPAGSSYQVSTTVHIPISYMGDYYIVVVTDMDDEVYESIYENNNLMCSDRAISVVMSPLADLIVTNIFVDDTVAANANATFQWTCTNEGLAATETNRWYDGIYLSEDSTLDVYSDRKIESVLHRGTLAKDSNYHVSASVQIPNLPSGQYYVFVKVDDVESVYEYMNESNNVIRRPQPIFITQPDFTATGIIIPDTGWSGRDFQASFFFHNVGESDYAGAVPVSISIKNNQDSSVLFNGSVSVNIPKYDSVLITKTLRIPQGQSGDYYCHVSIGLLSSVVELSYSNNHTISTTPIHVNLSPYPDLVVSNIMVPDTVNTGQSIQLNYLIENHGSDVADGYNSSQIRFYRIPDGTCYIIPSSDYQRISIEPDSQMLYYQTGIIPSSIPAGSYNVSVQVDANNVFYEYDGEHNNTGSGGICVVNVYPQDLQLLQLVGPDTVRWGQTAQYMLQVKNNSLVPTQQDRWNDKLRLVIGSGEHSLKGSHQGVLQPDSVYQNTLSIIIPYGAPASAVIEATVDDDYVNPDIDRSNNQLSKNIVIRPVPTPDLMVTSVEVLDDPISGQPMRIAYEATNIGQDSIVDKSWTDALFLSRNQSHDSIGAEVKTKSQRRTLRVGESYRDTITDVQVSLPNQGVFFVMVGANKNKNFFESRWDNNIAHSFINVVLPPPGDLIVRNIMQSDTVISGNNINATWSILNVGVDSIRGRGLSTLVYLSQDTSFDVNDKRIGVVENDYTALAPNDSIVQTFSGRLSGIAEGDYHLIVKTDVRNVFYEDSDDNNDAVGINTVHIKVKELLFDSLLSDSLYNNLPNDYVLRTREYRNETARIQVASPDSSLGTRNTLYVQHNGVGSNLNYTYSSIAQNTNSPYVYIPHTRDSLYYVSVYGVSSAGRQDVTLEANILSFELNEINPTEGGNNGNITLELLGSHFRPDMKVFLTKNTDTIYASKLFYNSYYQVFARFTFNHIDTGYYDVGVLNYCEGENMLAHAFHVTDNSLENISYNMIYPASPRSNRTISMVLEFGNIGNMDIVSPIIEITSAGGSYIALSADELSEKKQVLQIPLNIEGEPEGVLRPGKIGQITIYGYTAGQLSFLIRRVK